MKHQLFPITGPVLFTPRLHRDSRGLFTETWHAARYAEFGIEETFLQDNLSVSKQGVLRGLHFQHPSGQSKLVQVHVGSVIDIIVDVRLGSPTFGEHVGVPLDGETLQQLYVPVGFAHGFCVTSERAIFSYKCSNVYDPSTEQGVLYNDPALGLSWPIQRPIVSAKDQGLPRLSEIPRARLPQIAEDSV